MKKKVTSALAILLGISLVTGCGSSVGVEETTQTGGLKSAKETSTTASNLIESGKKSGTVDVLANIKNKYAAATIETANEFNEPIYNVASNAVFTVECNEAAMRSVYYDAFGVYTTIDFENPDKYIRDCATCTLEDGKLVIEPAVVDKFYDIEESTLTADTDTYGAWKTECDGTWGNLNKLYLVQKLDLQTGEKLAKPIITPFTINHDTESTTVKQKIDANNNYYLEWTPVSGASAYLVYQIDDDAFCLVNKTTDTKVSADNFIGQLDSDKWSEIVNKELQENGYDTTTSEKLFMNSDLYNTKNSKFAVVAVIDGKTSGISNIVDSNELADLLPYQVADSNIEVTINSVNDMPAYVDMTTVSGKSTKMVINYHGCTAKYEDDDSTTYYLYPSVYHTDLSPFRITVHGMPYSEFKAEAQQIGDRQDEITAKMPTSRVETEINVPNVPNREENIGISEQPEQNTENQPEIQDEPETPDNPTGYDEPDTPDEPTGYDEPETPDEPKDPIQNEIQNEPTNPDGPEIQDEPTDPDGPEIQDEPTNPDEPEIQDEPTTPDEPETPDETVTPDESDAQSDTPVQADPGTTNEAMIQVASEVNEKLSQIQEQSGISIDNIVFAESPLEEWIAYCLMARSETIPVPYSEFPEGADVEGTANKVLSMYRQNPTSGVVCDVQYSYDTETYYVSYADDTADRLNKTVEELKKAQDVANTVTAGLSSDYDKVVALNDYFCTNASYDMNSMATDVDMSSLSQSFIDAHTPYGILCNNYGVCESYSEAMALAGRLAGLNVIIETGDLYGAGGHEWNRVSIDGNWCILDITNNDNEKVPNGLCNITDTMAQQLLIADRSAYLFDASAVTDSYEYYRVNGDYAESVTDLTSKLREQLDSNDAAHVRCSEGITENDMIAAAQQLYSEGYNIEEGYFEYNIAAFSK